MQNELSNLPQWRAEFGPEFDVPATITDALHDTSWHNDTAPSFTVKNASTAKAYAALFADHPDVTERELSDEMGEDVARYRVFIDGTLNDFGTIWAGDDAAEAVKRLISADAALRVARQFSERLYKELTASQVATVIRRNAIEPDPNVCHSHDLTDSNVIMADAYNIVMGYPIDLQNDEARALWGNAWKIAKHAQFNPDQL